MAQPELERLSKDVAEELGDGVSSYTADGNTYTALRRESGINDAVGKLYDSKYERLQWQEFIRYYPQFKAETEIVIATGTSKDFTKDSSIRRVITVRIEATDPAIDAIAQELLAEYYHDALYNIYSQFAPSVDQPKFIEFEDILRLELGPVPDNNLVIVEGTIKPLVILIPEYKAFNTSGTDIIVPPTWHDEIVELAVQSILRKTQD